MSQRGKQEIGSFNIPETVTYGGTVWTVTGLGDTVFGNTNITSLSLPKTIKQLGGGIFWFATGPKLEWDLEAMGIEQVRLGVFDMECNILKGTLRFPKNLKVVENRPYGSVRRYDDATWPGFSGENLECIIYPDVEGILPTGFGGKSLVHITLPFHMTYAPNFSGHLKMEDMFLNNVDSIIRPLADNCPALKRVYLGKTCIQPRDYCKDIPILDQCPNVTDIIVDYEYPVDIYDKAFTNGQYAFTTLWVPEGCIDNYRSKKGWQNFLNIKEGRPDAAKCVIHTEDVENGSVEIMNASSRANDNMDFVAVNGETSFIISPEEGMVVDSVIVNGVDMTSEITSAPVGVRAKRMRRAAASQSYILSVKNIRRNVNVKVTYKDNGQSGISQVSIDNRMIDNTIYNISGQRMKNPRKGINIINSRKVVIK